MNKHVNKTAEEFILDIDHSKQTRMHGDSVKALLEKLRKAGHIGAADIAECYNTLDIETVRTKRINTAEAPAFKMPNFDNMTTSGLIDLLGNLREDMKLDKKLEGVYKEKLKVMLADEAEEEATKARVEEVLPDWAKDD